MKKQDIILSILFITFGILSRTVLNIGHNIEFVTALGLASGYFLSNRFLKYLVPMVIMLFTDLLIGNTMIFLFTWSAFALTPIMGSILKYIETKFEGNKHLKLGILSQASGVFFVVIFFLWTNFGVVVTSTMYPNTLAGLMQSYINAIPFLNVQLLSNFLIVPSLFIIIKITLDLSIIYFSNKNLKQS